MRGCLGIGCGGGIVVKEGEVSGGDIIGAVGGVCVARRRMLLWWQDGC